MRYIPACAGVVKRESSGSAALWYIPAHAGVGVLSARYPPPVRATFIPALAGDVLVAYRLAICHRYIPARVGEIAPRRSSSVNCPIPAFAGEPKVPGMVPCGSPVHPRVCGGGLDCPPSFEPRLCCIPVRAGKIVSRARFALKAQWCIPACAGQTKTTPDDLMAIWVHPRACGAAMRYDEADERRRGSSPRMRGLLRNRAVAGVSAGLIPARAGGLTAAPATAPAGSLPRLRLWCRPRRTGRSSIPVDSGSFQAGCAIRARLMSRVGYAVS